MPDDPASWRERLTAALPGPAASLVTGHGRAAVAALGAGGLAVALVVAVVALRGAPPAPELTLPRAGAPGSPGSAAPGESEHAGAAATAPAEGGEVGDTADAAYVHAAGAVSRPGVYRVRPGGRVADLLDAAGGPAPDADLDQVNLAARVTDGERVYVPRRGEAAPPVVSGGGSGGGAGTAAAGEPVDLNAATLEQLDALPGVGPATAQAILDYRREHGRFTQVQELLEVRGIGEAKLAALRSRVRV